MSFTQRFSEYAYPLAVEHADSLGAGANASGYVLLENYHRVALVVDVGDMAGTATLDIAIQQASSSTGTGVKAITGKSATQLTQAGGDGNQIVVIELRTEELDVNNGFEYVRFVCTVANANVEYSAILYGLEPRYRPVPTTNWSEIVD